MTTKVLVFTALTLMAFAYPVETNPDRFTTVDSIGPYNQCLMENTAFQDGEEIVYKIYYNWNFVWLSAGEVVFKVKEMERQFHLSAHGRTYKSYEWFYRVHDRYDSFVDKETLLPNMAIRDIQEGKYRLYDRVVFDQHNSQALSFRGKTRMEAEKASYPVDPCMHDVLSVIYFARNMDFNNMTPGADFPVKIFMDKEVWPLRVHYKGKEDDTKVKGVGRFKTIKFSPEVISGNIFSEGTEMNVYVTDDQNRIPVLIESPVSVGSIKAVLKSYKGLRYDMKAKVD